MSDESRGPGAVHGVALLELLAELPDATRGPLSGPVRSLLQGLSAVELRSWSTGRHFVHAGVVQSLAGQGIPFEADFLLDLPGLTDGVPFTLTFPRPEGWDEGAEEGGGTVPVEPPPGGWLLDLFVERIGLRLDDPIPAIRVPSRPGQPARLEASGSGSGVRFLARGVVRLVWDGSEMDVRLVPPPDPLNPEAAEGTVLEFRAEPPHFLFSRDGTGLSVGPVTLDDSEHYTPARVVERGHDARWRGIAADELTLYLPHNLPVVGDVSVGVRGLILGWGAGAGVQGDFVVEMGQTLDNPRVGIVFEQELEDASGTLQVVTLGPVGGAGGDAAAGTGFAVRLDPRTPGGAGARTARVRARLTETAADGTPLQGRWRIPRPPPADAQVVDGPGTGWMELAVDGARGVGPVIRFSRLVRNPDTDEVVPGPEVGILVLPPQPPEADEARAPWIGARLVEAGAEGAGAAPIWPDVADLAGPPEALAAVELVALAPGPTVEGDASPDPASLPADPLHAPAEPPADGGEAPSAPTEADPATLAWLLDGQEVARGFTLRLGAQSGIGEDPEGEGARTHAVTLRRQGRPDRTLRVRVLGSSASRPAPGPALWVGRQGAVTRVPMEPASGEGGEGAPGLPALGTPREVEPDRVLRTAKLEAFHRTAEVGEGAAPPARIEGGAPRVAPDTLGEFGISPTPPPPPPDWLHPRCLRLFSTLAVEIWERPKGRLVRALPEPLPALDAEPTYQAVLDGYSTLLSVAPTRVPGDHPDKDYVEIWKWLSRFPEGTHFAVVGRCCDRGPVGLNQRLAQERASYWADFLARFLREPGQVQKPRFNDQGDLVYEPVDLEPLVHLHASPIHWRGEQSPDWEGGTPEPGRFPASFLAQGWRRPGPEEPRENEWEEYRRESRGAELFASIRPGDSLLPEPDEEEPLGSSATETDHRPGEVRILVPGAEGPPDPEPPGPPRSAAFPFRFLLRGRWDSPAFLGNEDLLPSLVEMEFDWKANEVALPGRSDAVAMEPTSEETPRDPDTGAHIFRILGRFSHDARTGQTLLGMAWDSPGDDRGIFHLVAPSAGSSSSSGPGEFLAAAMGLGPALLGSLEPADTGGKAVALAALLAGAGVATGLGLLRQGRVTVQKLEAELETPGLGEIRGMRFRVTMDYHASFGVTTGELLGGVLDLRTAESDPVEIRYRKVGLEFREDEDFPDSVKLLFGDVSLQVANPGKWEIDGDLGRLLGITALRLGTGSVWLEVTMAPGLDLGVVRITEATVRVTIPGEGGTPGFELRGLAASVDIPGVLRGDGRLALGEGGSVAASLSLELVPAKLRVDASLVIRQPMVVVEVGVVLPVGLPLGATGLGIFGFRGRFVSNGTRSLPGEAGSDPVERELAWWRAPTTSKYGVRDGQFALGLGVVVGTLPDTGFTFHAQGMLVVEFPEPSVVLGVEARFASEPSAPAEQGGAADTGISFSLLGLVAIDRNGVALAIRGELLVPRILRVSIPISAYFPAPGGTGSEVGYFIHVGSDGVDNRTGEPVTAVILPGSLDLRVWSFFMIREKGITNLGGRSTLTFEGFSIGFGAGWELRWGESPLYIRVAATFLVGLGTRPFVLGGYVEVVGELFLLVVGIGIRGNLEIRVEGNGWLLQGEFCGKISLLFFTIEECVHVTAGSGTGFPPPPPLVEEIGLTDAMGRLVRAPQADNGSPGDFPGGEPVAWPDALPTLHFQRRVHVDLDPELEGFSPEPRVPGPGGAWSGKDAWTGTDNSRTLYRLRGVRLEREGAGGWEAAPESAGPSTWWFPSFRAAIPDAADTPESELEGWDLALLTRDPIPSAFEHLVGGGEGVEADPAQAVARVCEPAPAPSRHCLFGGDGRRQGVYRLTVASPPEPDAETPYRSRFHLEAREGFHHPALPMDDLVSWFELLGYDYAPGRLEAPGEGPTPPAPFGPDRGSWILPQVSHAARPAFTPGLEGRIRSGVHEPELILRVCLALPEAPPEETRCQDFTHLRTGMQITGPYQVGELVIHNTADEPFLVTDHFPAELPDGSPELSFPRSKGIRIEFAGSVSSVRVRVGYEGAWPLLVLARDAEGELVASASTPEAPGVTHTVTLEGGGIRTVEVAARSGSGALLEVCWTREGQGATPGHGGAERFVEGSRRVADTPRLPGYLPVVEGWGREGAGPGGAPPLPGAGEPWLPEIVGSGVSGGRGCVWVRYRPRGRGADSAPWTGLRILPYPLLEVAMVRLCGVSTEARQAWQLDEARRERLQDILVEDWTRPEEEGEGGDAGGSGRWRRGGGSLGPLLRADTRYRVAVDVQVAQWLDDGRGEGPPRPGDVPWGTPQPECTGSQGLCVHPPTTLHFPFRTASAEAIPDPDLPDPTAQWSFDPRALERYILGLHPGGDRPTHFLDDPLQVHFSVGWAEDLLAAYGLELRLRVRRTDPGPSPRPPGMEGPPFLERLELDVDPARIGLRWGPLPPGLLTPMERRLAAASEAAPCLPPRPGRGATASLDVPLEPEASWDLIVSVSASGDASDEMRGLVGPEGMELVRSHFRTSRYSNPGALLQGAGFTPAETPGLPPGEHLLLPDAVPASPLASLDALPGGPRGPGDDAALDEALSFLHMDPWPLPETPEAVVLWRLGEDATWRIVGLLVDSDEALIRPLRHEDPSTELRVEACRLHLPGGGTRELVLARGSVAGTRLLFLAPDPVALPPSAHGRLELVLARDGDRWRGERLVYWAPRIVLHESTPPEEDLP